MLLRLLPWSFVLVCALPAAAQTALAPPRGAPTFDVQLVVRDGEIALDRSASSVQLNDHAPAFETCGLTTARLRDELNDYLEALLRAKGSVLLQLAMLPAADPADQAQAARRRSVESQLAELARSDVGTASLLSGRGVDGAWRDADEPLTAWTRSPAASGAGLVTGARFSDLYMGVLKNPAFADGPLLPTSIDSDEIGASRIAAGRATFVIAPPLLASETRIRPTANEAQWERLRSGLAHDVLEGFECRLWHRDRIVARVQDYAEMRGIALRSYRTPDAARAALNLVPPIEMPRDRAGLDPQRPTTASTRSSGGRILFAPDPLLETVYVEEVRGAPENVLRALYLLLPTPDYRRLLALLARPQGAPAERLCRLPAPWKPAVAEGTPPSAVRLTVLGSDFDLARAYMTRRELAERLQRLGALGVVARVDFARDIVGPAVAPRPDGSPGNPMLRVATLIVEPAAAPAATAPAGAGEAPLPLQACIGTTPNPPAPAADARTTAPLTPDEHRDVVPAKPPRNAQRPALQNEIRFGVEQRAGKPLGWELGYARTGLGDDDTFSARLGQEGKPSGDIRYAKDFVAFAALERRLQLSARVYSQSELDRPIDAARPDERRNGAEIRATLDLWRDVAASFGQLELGISRSESELSAGATGAPARTRITLQELSLVASRSLGGTPSSARFDAVATVAHGRADGDSFAKGGVELRSHAFWGAFTQWDLHARAHALAGPAPAVEYWSFGGEDSVRGYATDRAVGRRLWAIQSEFWLPLPWQPRSESLASTLRRSLALAVIADVGAVTQTLSSFSGTKAGAGVGLRYVHGDAITLRLDAAHPINASDPSDRKTRFHFSVSTARTLR